MLYENEILTGVHRLFFTPLFPITSGANPTTSERAHPCA